MKVLRDLRTKLDRLQRHLPPLAVAVAVNKKFSDDQANQYVVSLGWYGFVSIYPLLLVVVTVFGFIGVPSLGHGVVSTLHQFPVVGPQFNPARPSSNLHGSVFGLVVGTLVLLYGAQGVTQSAVLRAMAQVWGVDVHDLPGFAARLVRSLIGLAVIGATFVVNAVLATLATSPRSAAGISVLVIAAMLAINVLFYWAAFWVLTPLGVPVRALLAGSTVGALGFTLLITVGSGLIRHQIRNSSATYGQLGIAHRPGRILVLVGQDKPVWRRVKSRSVATPVAEKPRQRRSGDQQDGEHRDRDDCGRPYFGTHAFGFQGRSFANTAMTFLEQLEVRCRRGPRVFPMALHDYATTRSRRAAL